MNKRFYDADALLKIFKAVKQQKCSRCGSHVLKTHKHCKDCDIKFIVDLLEVFPKEVVIQEVK